MIYTLIISLLIEGRFCLLSLQSFSFQMMSEFIDIFVKSSNFMSRGWGFGSLFCPGGRVFVHNDCPGGRVFAPFESCPGGMVMDEIDTCIKPGLHMVVTVPERAFGLARRRVLRLLMHQLQIFLGGYECCCM